MVMDVKLKFEARILKLIVYEDISIFEYTREPFLLKLGLPLMGVVIILLGGSLLLIEP